MALLYMKMFYDYLDAIEPLGDAERGRLLTALLEYGRTGEVPQLNGNERFIFPMIRAQMDRDKLAYEEQSEAVSNVRREAGKKGGQASAARRNQIQANASKTNQTQANQAKDKEKDLDKEKEKEESSSTISDEIVCSPADAVGRVLNAWNGLNVLKPVKKLQSGTNRDTMLKARIREYGIDSVLEAVEIIPRCPFLLGENRNGWTITFDWFVKPNNFPKVLEGNYLHGDGEAKSSNPFKNISVEDW